jgi:hypothetical protein
MEDNRQYALTSLSPRFPQVFTQTRQHKDRPCTTGLLPFLPIGAIFFISLVFRMVYMNICTGIVTFWHPRHKYGFIQGDSGEKSIHFTIATHSVIAETEPGTIGFKKVPASIYPKKGDKVVYAPTKREKNGPKTHRWTYLASIPKNDLLALTKESKISDMEYAA